MAPKARRLRLQWKAKRAPEELVMGDEAEVLPLEQRRELFAALIAAQDRGLSVGDSRELVASRYGVDVAAVRAVEDEGLDGRWPPFGKG